MSKQAILLVNSNPVLLRALEGALRRAGFEVTIAVNGREAIDQVAAAPPDLVISEIRLEEIDGYAFCQRLKTNPLWAEIPFVFLTAVQEIEPKIRALELGVDQYLTMPIYIKEIVTRVRILVEKRGRKGAGRVGYGGPGGNEIGDEAARPSLIIDPVASPPAIRAAVDSSNEEPGLASDPGALDGASSPRSFDRSADDSAAVGNLQANGAESLGAPSPADRDLLGPAVAAAADRLDQDDDGPKGTASNEHATGGLLRGAVLNDSSLVHVRGPYRQFPAVLRKGLHPRTAEMLRDYPKLAERAVDELDEFITLIWAQEVPTATVAALARLKLQLLSGVMPWTLWDYIEQLDVAFRCELIPAAVARSIQQCLMDARRKARGIYLGGLIALAPVAVLGVALTLMNAPIAAVGLLIGYAGACIAAGAHVMQLSNQHIADLSRMINDLKGRIPELQRPSDSVLEGDLS